MDKRSFETKGNYIGGEFRSPIEPNGEFKSISPADFSDEVGTFRYAYSTVDEAVGAAQEASRTWKGLSLEERASYLKKYQEVIKKRADDLAEAMAREVGKPLWESKTEVKTMIGKVDVTINESMKLTSDFRVKDIVPGANGQCRYRPLGVLAVIGPFNFPGHLPNGHIVPGLLTGNTIVFKPSEKTPLVGQLMAECFHEAGFPKGVFNLVQGEKEVGRRLCTHEHVAAVLFTGSYEVGLRIKQDTLQQHWKLLALEMGGKNASIIWDDANLDTAVFETLFSAYVTTGQRCTATSRIIIHQSKLEEFVERFHERAKAFEIGHPLNDPFMGPLIDRASVDRYVKFMGIAIREGYDVRMRGKELQLDWEGNYVSPSIAVANENSLDFVKKSVVQQTELFAPAVSIIGVDDLDHAIAITNLTQYGLATSVFTGSSEVYEKVAFDAESGIVNWNKSTVGASGRLPFGGFKKSGNHFPTALTATQYCTHPVASLEVAEPGPVKAAMPGLNWG